MEEIKKRCSTIVNAQSGLLGNRTKNILWIDTILVPTRRYFGDQVRTFWMDKYLAAKVNTPFRVLFFWVRYGRNERAICVVHVFMSPLPIYHSRKACCLCLVIGLCASSS
ncbi:hypothetical protein O6H91_10G033400 [Diphasiastrum complanatum]|uniref:Uncharacterized protein n=1 Tax=Diphasiastrum complanatum TaxID=34168 RepID=A0ACC2CFM4_DIPCM|nr:hypothetical protein O6H91_10G033400 [Diphasiastrum complanatum]